MSNLRWSLAALAALACPFPPAGHYLKRDPALGVWQHYGGWANDPTSRRAPIRFGTATMKAGSDVLEDPRADFSTLDPARVSTIHVGGYIQGDGRSKQQRGGANIGVYGLVEVVDKRRLRVRPAFRADGTGNYSIGTLLLRPAGGQLPLLLPRYPRRTVRFKNEAHAHDADRFILGTMQRRWLLDGVRNPQADFIFIISPDPWVIYHSGCHVRPEKS